MWSSPCQSGSWYRQTEIGVSEPLYLEGGSNYPASCPLGWEEVDLQSLTLGFNDANPIRNWKRTCVGSGSRICQPLYLESSTTPGACPAGWIQVDLRSVTIGVNGVNPIKLWKRTCVKC